MKNTFLTLIAFSATMMAANAAVLFTNPITNTNPSASNPFTSGQTVAANLTASGIGRGPGINANAGGDRYNATAWTTAAAIDLNDYFTFTITPNAGFEIDFTSFVYTGAASGSGPTSFAFRSSVGGYSTNIGSATSSGSTISLTGASFQNITAPITFRFYAWGASSAAGTFSINDFTFNGDVVAAVPEPSTYAMLFAGMGMMIWVIRRKRAQG